MTHHSNDISGTATVMTSGSKISRCDANRKSQWLLTSLPALTLAVIAGCSSPSAFLATDSPNSSGPATATGDGHSQSGVVPAVVVDASMTTTVTPLSGQTQAPGQVRLDSPSSDRLSVRPAVLTRDPAQTSGPTIIPMSHQVMVPPDCQDSACQFTPAEPRISPAFARMSPADMYPDEYLADGGDRRLPVHYFAGDRQGFDTEDTIAEYSDHDGKLHVRASNRVAVYAPRFGSVRVIEGADAGLQIHHAARTTEFSAVGSMERKDSAHQSVKEDGFVAVESRQRADGAESRDNAILSQGSTRLEQNNKIDQGLQAQSINGMHILERLQGARFQEELANAAIWSRDLFPELSASTSVAGEARTRVTAQAAIGIDQRAEKSEIHIVKLADRETADAGDTIHFTIRFINTGDYDLYNVRIVDNLTPRLQFLAESAKADCEGQFSATPNGEGSDIIAFEMAQPLGPHKSGTIEFDVTVK